MNRKPKIRLYAATLLAVGVFLMAVNAAAAPDARAEATAFFERFAAAQNAHDIAAVRPLLWDSPDFLWISRGNQTHGAAAALSLYSSYYKGTWHIEPDLTKLTATWLDRDVMQLLVPVAFTRGDPGQLPQTAKYLISQTLVRRGGSWRVATIIPVANTALK